MKLLGNTVKSLQTKTDNIFNVFSKTLSEIESVNKEVRQQKAKRLETISKVQDELSSLEVMETKNLRLAQKIEDFLK